VTFSRKLTRLLVLTGMLLWICTHDSFAYVDPGSGSFVLQLIMAGLLGAALAVKAFWRNIREFFSKLLLKK